MATSVGMGRGTVQVIGHIWQPGIGLCAAEQTIRGEDLDRLKFQGRVDRDDALTWADTAFGDFREIVDIAIVHHDPGNAQGDLDWQNGEESEATYSACMAPVEDGEEDD